jgi:hypothetical protein
MPVLTASGKRAGRFSRNEATPSAASAEAPRARSAALSRRWASIGCAAPSMRHISCRVSATDTGAACVAISAASDCARASSSPGSHSSLTRPPARASSASKTWPPMLHSSAFEMPATRGRNQLAQASGTMPRRAKTKPKRASREAMRMSIGSSIDAPMPTAAPFTAAISGLVLANRRSASTPPPSRPGSSPDSASRAAAAGSKARAPSDRSKPTQKARPAPVITMARTASCASARSSARHSSRRMARVIAFMRSGRCSVSVSTGPDRSQRRVSKAGSFMPSSPAAPTARRHRRRAGRAARGGAGSGPPRIPRSCRCRHGAGSPRGTGRGRGGRS